MTNYSDQELAVRTILGEAGNQGYNGQLAVANVINNRVQSGQFGSGVQGVITPSQFNGFDSQTPVNSPAYQQALTAWNSAQGGFDNTGGATYFANPSLSQAPWAQNLSGNNALQIGDQFFTNNTNGVPFMPSMGGLPFNGIGTDQAAQDAANAQAQGEAQGLIGSDPLSSAVGSSGADPLGGFLSGSGGGGSSDPLGGSSGFDSLFGGSSGIGGLFGGSSSSSSSKSGTGSVLDWTGIPQAIQNMTAEFDASIKNLFIRGAIIALGLIIVIAALWRLADPTGEKTAAATAGAAAAEIV